MKTKVLNIEQFWDPEIMSGEKIVTIKKLSFGEMNDIQSEVSNVKVIGSQTLANPNIGRMRDLIVLKGIKQAPFKLTLETVRDLSAELGEFLYSEIEEFNTVSPNSKVPSNSQ